MAENEELTRASEAGNQRGLVTYAIFVGLTPLIPVPFVDDLAQSYFRRRLVRLLAASHGRALGPEDLDALVAERGGGCLSGCVVQAVVYPLKKVFRKIFYFLEWKRAADLTSQTYHYGYLLNYALQPRAGGESIMALRGASAVREAIEAVCRDSPIKPVESAVGGTFRQSKRVLGSAAGLLAQTLRRITAVGRPDEEQVARAIETVEPAEEREIETVVARMQKAIAGVPEEHFRNLRARLDARLGLPPS
ncbi:MAG: hypothetical protein LC802_19560 [Acidobacteria bacterium]|nr:hypothetical protein [Acidobacteriota bacterium]